MKLTPQELAHVLAALRFVQQAAPADFPHMVHFTATAHDPLSDNQVDALCWRINTGSLNQPDDTADRDGVTLAATTRAATA